LALVPESLAATVSGTGDASGYGHGGSFAVPALHLSISGPLPLDAGGASVSLHSSVALDFNLNFPEVNEDAGPPIQLAAPGPDGGRTTIVLHLGEPKLQISTVVFGPVTVKLG